MSEQTEFLLARITEDAMRAEYVAQYGDTGGLFTPARVLAECAAKRAIVGMCESTLADQHNYDGAPLAEMTLRTLTAVYSDHPDYSAGMEGGWRG